MTTFHFHGPFAHLYIHVFVQCLNLSSHSQCSDWDVHWSGQYSRVLQDGLWKAARYVRVVGLVYCKVACGRQPGT